LVSVVRKPSTLHERVLAVWSLVFGAWILAMVLGQFGISWRACIAGLVVAVVSAGSIVLFARSAFRRVVARPHARKGVDGCLGRHPWSAAAIIAAVYMAIPGLSLVSGQYLFGLRQIPAGFVWATGGWAIFAVGMATFRLLADRQLRQRASG
jgi:hypothetical protein